MVNPKNKKESEDESNGAGQSLRGSDQTSSSTPRDMGSVERV